MIGGAPRSAMWGACQIVPFLFWQGMGSKRLDTISDYARHGFDLRVACRACKRVTVIDALALSGECSRASQSRKMPVIQRRLKCQGCGGRDVTCGPVERTSRA